MTSNQVTDQARTSSHPAHPRRPTAERSVSLKHPSRARLTQPSKRQRTSDSSSDSGVGNKPVDRTVRANSLSHSPSSLNPLGGQTSSGESSNAEKWFEKSNNELRDPPTNLVDNEPPFFMRNSSSSETPPDMLRMQLQQQQQQHQQQQQRLRTLLDTNESTNSLPLRTGLLRLGTDGSSTEDFRSVIDDLTIKNKKLKRRLKKYEKLHDSHLKDDKLFEVRFHGLPPAKKRELEETLRKFAAGLHTGGANAFPPNGYASLVPLLNTSKTASSHTSAPNLPDSAYASMSASNQGSSGLSASDAKGKKSTPSHLAARSQNIHSYLHDIPESLVPQSSPASMSERQKKRLVVRRLEGVFAGKDAAKNGHQQSMQQQEVSQSAALADRSANEATGHSSHQEGAREASIMRNGGDESVEPKKKIDETPRKADIETTPSMKVATAPGDANDSTTEQRPTRPLDLDIQRAQVPADNIRYMRHIGFSPLDPELAAAQEEGHGWIYLNFLINMAQLHTVNVTPDFVRKALEECSNKFEISSDGRKVRWRGGIYGVQTSSSTDNSPFGITDNTDGQSPRKRPKLSHKYSSSTTAGRAVSEANKFAYTPLFFHRDSTDDGDDSSSSEDENEGDESPMQAQAAGDSSGMTSSGMRTVSGLQTGSAMRIGAAPKKSKRDDGPIIFYNNASFCTDLSGDARAQAGQNSISYTTATNQPIGKPYVQAHDIFEKRGPLSQAAELPEPMNLSDNPIPASMELGFPVRSPMNSDKTDTSQEKHVELEVTGIGGVWPADNFAISVESRHARVDQNSAPKYSSYVQPRSVPPKLADVLRETSSWTTSQRPAVHKQTITSSKVQQLAPTPFPPAINYRPFGEEQMDDEEDFSDEEDRMSIAPDSPPGAMPPYTAPQPVDFAYAYSEEDDEAEYSDDGSENADEEDEGNNSDDEESSDDGSVDFLAPARKIDPQAVREKEREYDANMAERLAEEIPAGSSAATAGGGSGFNSPASAVTKEEYVRARKEARAAATAASTANAPAAVSRKGSRNSAGSGTAAAPAGVPGAMDPPPHRPAELQRARTSDSMRVEGMDGSSEASSSDDEMGDAEVSDVGS